MKTFRHAACVLLAAVSLLASPTYATSFSTDQSDLYYSPAESGWGLQLVQRGSVIFATLVVYDSTGQPTWYAATMDFATNATNSTWTGALYVTTGTYFGSPWNPSALTVSRVGTMTWQAPFIEGGTLTYVVNGVTVVKNVVRQTLVLDDFSGHYSGGFHSEIGACANPTLDGTHENIGILDISQNGSAIDLVASNAKTGATCSYTGTLTQFGQMGEIAGSYACSDGTAGTFAIFGMQGNQTGITGRFSATAASPLGCQSSGWFGGLVVTTF
jgi:hypothetical protein